MGTREELDAMFCELLDSDNVYYQPPENLNISYPCIVYSLNGHYNRAADNRSYHRRREYELVFITRDPDSEMIEKIADLPYCSMGRPYSSDNLYHYPYTIYF